MIALSITDVKGFMKQLLTMESFDNFLVLEAVISTATTFTIDGRLNKEFTDESTDINNDISDADSDPSADSLQTWGKVRPICFELIKGKRLPLYFKVVLQLSGVNTGRFLSSIDTSFSRNDVSGLYMNISFDRKELRIVSGTSVKTFSMDKSLDQEWDNMVKRFLTKNNIEYEML